MKKFLWALIALFALAQLMQPSTKNPIADPVQSLDTVAQPPAEVAAILRRVCYDCHSNETKWPWYSRISPVSWWVAHHVEEGREAVNFSVFGSYSTEDRAEALEECAEQIREGEMPLGSYLPMHPEARLLEAEKTALLAWLGANGGGGKEGDDD